MSVERDQSVPARIHLRSLREDVLVEPDEHAAGFRVVTRWGEYVFDDVAPAVRASVERMSLGPVSVENVALADPAEHAGLATVLETLSGSVVHALGLDDGEGILLSAIPMAEHATFAVAEIDPLRPVKLSRFAAVRAERGGLVMESPLALYKVILHRPLAARVVAALGTPAAITDLADVLRMAEPVIADIVAYLVASGVLLLGWWDEPQRNGNGSRPNDGSPGARFAEDHDPVLSRWSHHDLMFHAQSRMGRHGGPSGAAFPHADGPRPAVARPDPPGPRFPLYRPESLGRADLDATLSAVIEAEQICPDVTDLPVTARQLGELLYRAARIRSVSSRELPGVRYEVSDRPYLSVAGLYELEIYLSLYRCEGLPPGIFHYDPAGHALTLVNDSAADLDKLLDTAKTAAGHGNRPSALISITARVERLSWMFGGVGYSTALMHVGALHQTLYLVATALGLAACALALDTSDTTDRVLRLNWPAEIGIGECIVGPRPE